MSTTQPVASESSTLARAIWNGSEPGESGAEYLHHALLATSCFDGPDVEEYHHRLLGEFLTLFRAERAYLFHVNSEAPGSFELDECLASLDLDGDSVPNPEKKAPVDLATKAAKSGHPACVQLSKSGDDSGLTRSVLLLPAASREKTVCVAVLENRFKDLEVTEDALCSALVYCRSLAGHTDLAETIIENECLWKDLTRVRDEAKTALEAAAVAAQPISATAKMSKPKRDGLKGDYSMIVGSSLKMLDILQVIDRISNSTAPVLINGESGTGKELAALAVHHNSPRREQTFVSENCGAITETLLESELFGYVKGAFTGANKDHKGLFELATGGTLFLDEVGDMSLSMQKKLLRVLQEGVIRRVGAKDFTPVEVRIVSATNKNLLEECRAGNFREDLYYRLNVINLVLPPLRDRRDDIPKLVEFFLREIAGDSGEVCEIDAAALQQMVQYSWPGNIRELQNEVRKMATLCDNDTIFLHDLSEPLRGNGASPSGGPDWTESLAHLTLKEATEHLEKALIERSLHASGGNKSLVAKTLQIPKTSLYNKIHKYEL